MLKILKQLEVSESTVRNITQDISTAYNRDGIHSLQAAQKKIVLQAKTLSDAIRIVKSIKIEYGKELESTFTSYVKTIKDALTGNIPFNKSCVLEIKKKDATFRKSIETILVTFCYETPSEKSETLRSRILNQSQKILNGTHKTSPPPASETPPPSLESTPSAIESSSTTSASSSNDNNITNSNNNQTRNNSHHKSVSIMRSKSERLIGDIKKSGWAPAQRPKSVDMNGKVQGGREGGSGIKAGIREGHTMKVQGMDFLKGLKEFLKIIECSDPNSAESEKTLLKEVKILMKKLNFLINDALDVVSDDWVHLLIDDENSLRTAIRALVLATLDKRIHKSDEEKLKLTSTATAAITNFIESSELFVES